jgi:GNAT superfamily N-acetyltransferase
MYATPYADAKFTSMGFGADWGTRQWSDEECKKIIEERDVVRSWKRKGMGDFGLRIVPSGGEKEEYKNEEQGQEGSLKILSGSEYAQFMASVGGIDTASITWIGYAGIRDATMTSLPPSDRVLPHWLEMVEVRYGIHPEHWGKGYARQAAEAVMEWGFKERGVKRFIAETEKENERSGRVLGKLGFEGIGTDY